jgi:magnesium-transporting ATPase (P-type)
MAAFFFVLFGAGWHWGVAWPDANHTYRQATTACLTAIVLMQVVNVHLCRSEHLSIASVSPFGNRLITAGVAMELMAILVIDYTAVGHAVFGTEAIPFSAWLIVVPFGVAMLLLEEARKAIARAQVRAHAPSQG